MASAKKEITERYSSYKIVDIDKADRAIDSAAKHKEILEKFDEIDSLSTEISEQTFSALTSYYDNIAAFIKDLDKAVGKAKESMEGRNVDRETVAKLEKISEVYKEAEKGIENVSEVKKINRLAEKNLKELTASLERQKQISEKITEMKQNPAGVEQKDFIALKLEQAELEEVIDEKQKKKKNYNERLKDITKDFSVVEYSETFSSDLVSTFKEFAKDANVSKDEMQIFKGLIGYNNGKYEITYPGYDKVKDSIKTLDDLKDKQRQVDSLCDELGIESPARDAVEKTKEEEAKQIETPEEIKPIEKEEDLGDEEKEEESSRDSKPSDGDTLDPQTALDDLLETMEPVPRQDDPMFGQMPELFGSEVPELDPEATILPGMEPQPQHGRQGSSSETKTTKGAFIPTFKGHKNSMFEGKIAGPYKPGVEYMDPEQKQKFYEEMGYVITPTDIAENTRIRQEISKEKEKAKEEFVSKMEQVNHIDSNKSSDVFDVLYEDFVIDEKGQIISVDKEKEEKIVQDIMAKAKCDDETARLLYTKALQCAKTEVKIKPSFSKVVKTRAADAREWIKAKALAMKHSLNMRFNNMELEEKTEEGTSRSGR